MRIVDSSRDRAQALVLALGIAIVVAVAPFAPGLLGAGILYVVFAPAHRRLARHLAPRAGAAVVLILATALVLVPGLLLVALMIDRAPTMLRGLQESPLLAQLAALRVAGVDVGAQMAAVSGALLTWLSRRGLELVGSVAHATLNLAVALFGLYYMLLARPASWTRVADYLPFSRASAERLRARFHRVTEAMLLGIALTAALQGSIVGIGFWLVNLPDPLFWGAVTAFVSVLPLFGSALVWLPGVVVLLAAGRHGAALALAVIGAGIASNIDNLTRPMVYRRVSHIHPMTTVVGAFAGVALFGLVGVLLGPLAISYFFELLRIYRDEYGRDERGTSEQRVTAPIMAPVTTPAASPPYSAASGAKTAPYGQPEAKISAARATVE